MDPSKVRRSLIDQHLELRGYLREAELLADDVRHGGGAAAFALALGRLREAFERHNRHEEAVLVPLLELDPSVGPQRVARMLEEHTEEHRVMLAFFARPTVEVAHDLADWAEELLAHMEAEERTFLSVKVLKALDPAQ